MTYRDAWLGMSDIATPRPLIDVLTRSHVSVTGLHRAGGIRTHDLLNPIQAFYQAELRPEVVEEHCLSAENREKQLGFSRPVAAATVLPSSPQRIRPLAD